MQIYAEYLFIENFISGAVILVITAQICGLHINKKRIFAGGLLCGLFSFSLLLDFRSIAIGLVVKLIFSVMLIQITFGILKTGSEGLQNRKSFVRVMGVFYIISFLMGGLAMAILYIGNIQGVSNNGFVYGGSVSYIKVYFAIGLTAYVGNTFANFIKDRVVNEDMRRWVLVKIGDKEFSLLGYVDSGNCLRDPVSGRQVAVISADCAGNIFGVLGEEERDRRYCIVPYRSTGVKRGIMEGIRTDKVTVFKSIKSGDGRTIKGMILAVHTEEFAIDDIGGPYQMLLNREAIEGGLVQ